MKKTKNNFMFLAAAMLLLGTSAIAQGQVKDEGFFFPNSASPTLNAPMRASEATHDYDWYAAKTYTWTNANGQTQTASLVDEVTDPYQMFDMLKWVYTNPEIPGIKHSGFTNSSVYYGEQFYYTRHGLLFYSYTKTDPGWGITDVTAPNEDGHTLFLVKLKNYATAPGTRTESKSDLITYFRNNIQSIKLLTDGMRAGSGNNQGTMFNIEGEFNRFFIIGKGKTYYCPPQQDSEAYAGAPYAPFYNMFEEYSPTTNDTGATINDFYEKMNEGEVYPVIHDCTSVIHFEHYFSMAGKNSTEEKSMTGMIIFIPDNRGVYNERNYSPNHQPEVGMYTIHLDANAAPADQELTYDVTLDWTSSLNTIVKSEVPQTYTVYIVITDEFGNQSYQLLTTTTETTYTYQVPQEEHSYTINYIVHGYATENDAFEAWSNIDDVIIPGTNDFLGLVGDHYESDFVPEEEMNYYRNFLSLKNEDMLNALTTERVQAGENEFTLYRFDTANPDVMIPVAQLNLSVAATFGGVFYNIEYENQEPLAGYNVPITTSGGLNTGANNTIDLSSILFVDQFNESTATNEHPSLYGYVLLLNDSDKGTNTVEVPVLKTASTIDGFYTLEEIMADTEPELLPGVKNALIEMPLVNNPAIYYYTIQRGDNEEPNLALSKLQRRTDGTFMEMNDYMGNAGTIYEEGDYYLFDNKEILTGEYNDFASYVPVIWSFGTDRVNHDGENSYGSPIWKSGVAGISGHVTGTKSSTVNGEWLDENNKKCVIYNPTINVNMIPPTEANVDYEPYMYRVWRLCDDVRGYTMNANNIPVNDPTAPRNAKELIIEEITNDYSITIGDEWDLLGFGALANTQIKFLVRVYYKKVDNNRAEETNDQMYYVVESTLEWTNIPTSVNEINVANEVSKTYVNAQGIKSDKPFNGLNIVITRYSDGTVRTSKVIK